MGKRITILVAAAMLALATACPAAETPTLTEGPVATDQHAVLPGDAPWAGVTVVIILAMFAAAAGVGVTVRLNAPTEVPVAHSHDEPPGASHHHGSGGTH